MRPLRPPQHILFLVENLSVPLDRRVWNESLTLVAAGYDVSVICPRGKRHDRSFYERRDGVRIYRYPWPPLIPGLIGYVWEYGYALTMTLLMALVVYARHPFDAIHACNPPDLFFLVGWVFRRRGVAFVFDHHDANPEILVAKRGGEARRGLPELVVSWAERRTFAAAEVVISPNDSYRRIALTRGGKAPQDVFTVRSGPRLEEFAGVSRDGPRPAWVEQRGAQPLLGYIGVMGRQDGVDVLVRATARLVEGGHDVLLYLAGDGESYTEVAGLVQDLGLTGRVHMPGYQDRTEFVPILRDAEVCVAPDPPGPFNDISTMNKIVEYMAMGLCTVAFGLTENRVSGGDAAVYPDEATPEGLAAAIAGLLGDAERRRALGEAAERRFREELAWERAAPHLLEAYRRLKEKIVSGAV